MFRRNVPRRLMGLTLGPRPAEAVTGSRLWRAMATSDVVSESLCLVKMPRSDRVPYTSITMAYPS